MADACIYLMDHFDALSHQIKPNSTSMLTGASFVNIGTGKEITIRELAYLIKRIVGFRGEIVFNPSKPDGTLRLSARLSL